MRYVFDTCVLVAGLRSRRGSSFVILQAIGNGLLRGVASTTLLLEYQDVLKRDANLEQFWAKSDEVDIILGMLASRLEPIQINFSWRPQLTDPDDEMVLECSVNAQSATIVTFNVRDFLPEASQFQIEVIQPGTLLQRCNLVKSQ
jgi:putative PIN family toxin of toxin-antitoxin system